ncbi:MAG: VirB8/TrbF family protein, partial [Steroidobacteraceae bacterium]
MSKDAALERYLQEAASWDADRAAMNARSSRIAWRITVSACVLTALAILALVLLTPLKRVEPFVIRVDNATGIVDVVPTFARRAEMPELVTRYFLMHYVTVCERFNFATAESDYEECAAFHAAARNQAWVALWDRANPDSPLNLYKDGSS